jgi:Ca2+-binding RTX toxin-like protein
MATIGYYDMVANHGVAAQAGVITGIGDTAVNLTTLGFNRGADVIFVDNEDQSGVNADYIASSAALGAFVGAGGVLILNDASSSLGTHDANSQYENESNQINFVNDHGPMTSGVAGSLTDASLDNLLLSSYGFQDVQSDADAIILATRDNPFQAVTTVIGEGEGWIVVSSVDVGTLLTSSPDGAVYAGNLIDYAATLSTQPEIILSDGNDKFHNKVGGAEEIYGLGGADKILGLDGNDFLHGNDGNDQLSGGNDDDVLWGGAGNDLLNGQDGDDQLWGEFNKDRLNGGNGDDYLIGGSDKDVLSGDVGADTLGGGSGNDKINGGDGDDAINGNSGADTMTGGIGADTFYFGQGDSAAQGVTRRDVITDFTHHQDRIDLTEFRHSFAFSVDGTLHHTAYEIALTTVAGITTVSIDIDGDGLADSAIKVEGGPIDSTDFVT